MAPGGGEGPITVRRYGTAGPVVALLHGGPGAPGFTVLEPLQRRWGGVPLTVARHVADLAAVLPPGAALVGWSWGAMLALSFAAAHPGRARSLALVGCGTYDEASRAALGEALDARLGEDGRRRAEALKGALEAASSERERDRALGQLGQLVGAAEACDPLPFGEGETWWFDARGHEETWADVLRLQAEGVEPQSFRAIACPVLMLHGDDDPHPGPATFEVLRQFIPQLQYRGFPRCGHEPWAERHAREPFLEVLRAWLADPAGPGPAG
ncbi:MAG: hypothetical protein H6Q11_1503 [Acidobacteria bacterium]|nr:hypothetical protein [Acidobacteriota bacterium]